MAAFTPKELLDHLLQGNPLDPDDLDRFIRENSEETQDFEYKDGSIATRANREKGRQTIRQYVSGFANSDGGILFVGVNEAKPRGIAPCDRTIGDQPLKEWAGRCLQEMAGYFSPFPRSTVIEHPEGPVLAIAVARAPSLVPCVESRSLKYYFRIEDSPIPIPEFLIADLVLGKRQRPTLDIHSPSLIKNQGLLTSEAGQQIPVWEGSFSCTVENLSLMSAEDVRVGAVLWSLVKQPDEIINKHLRGYLEVKYPTGPQYVAVGLTHLRGGGNHLDPFQTRLVNTSKQFFVVKGAPTHILGAVYVIDKATPPTWFQLEFGSLVGGFSFRSITKDFQPTLIRKDIGLPQVVWTQDPFIEFIRR